MSGEKTLDQIQETQAALRESIEQAKDFAEKSEQLIAQHREEIDRGEHPDGSAE